MGAGVTLLGQGIRQQARGQSTGTNYGSNGFHLGMMGSPYQPGQSLNGMRGGKLDALAHHQYGGG